MSPVGLALADNIWIQPTPVSLSARYGIEAPFSPVKMQLVAS